MPYFEYYSRGKKTRIRLQGAPSAENQVRRTMRAGGMAPAAAAAAAPLTATLHAQRKRFEGRFADLSESQTLVMAAKADDPTTVIATESLAVAGARASEIKWIRSTYGMEVVREGRQGKLLFAAPPSEPDRVELVFKCARELYERGKVSAAHPNFLRVALRPAPSQAGVTNQWSLDNPGNPGLVGADVHALAAWTITRGDPSIRAAVLDEGVDTKHKYLAPVVVAEQDFVDGNPHARPDGDDAHGTACAGIISSQNDKLQGLATGVGLVAARIAKSNAFGQWIFDDFETADAIDWCWDDARSDVLSNSWGGGPPADVISGAIERARTQGRGGLGSVVVFAAGNSQSPLDFPGDSADVLTVGASNQWDERKTTASQDGESWWGSNYGDNLDLLAPGVSIRTTDITGARGYSTGLTTDDFNGTSSATPHVAAAAALILAIRPDLTEEQVRQVITKTADPLTASGDWNRQLGHGRLNVYAALRAARRI